MIINHKHIQGIFKYSPTSEYEKGDLVVEGEVIYICTAGNPTSSTDLTVSGQTPSSSPENYKVYLGNKVASLQDYLSYIDNPNSSEDKYISTYSLSAILNNYMMGFDEKGMIKDFVSDQIEDGIEENVKISEMALRDPLEEILQTYNINNAVFMVDRDSKSTRTLGFLGSEDVEKILGKTGPQYILLRQYSYYERGKRVKIQELIDFVTGESKYRYSKESNISAWKTTFYGSADVKTKLEKLHSYYEREINELERAKTELVGNFSFREIDFDTTIPTAIEIQCSDPGEKGYMNLGSSSGIGFQLTQPKSLVIDVTVRELEVKGGKTYQKNRSCTIDLRDCVPGSTSSFPTYHVSDNTSISISITEDRKKAVLSLNSTYSVKFVGAYYRKQFEK